MDDNAGMLGNRWASIEKDSATSELRKDQAATLSTVVQGLREEKFKGIGNSQSDSSLKKIQRKRPVKSAFVTQCGNIAGGGTSLVLNALAAYLRYLEGTSRDEWQEYESSLYFSLCHDCH